MDGLPLLLAGCPLGRPAVQLEHALVVLECHLLLLLLQLAVLDAELGGDIAQPRSILLELRIGLVECFGLSNVLLRLAGLAPFNRFQLRSQCFILCLLLSQFPLELLYGVVEDACLFPVAVIDFMQVPTELGVILQQGLVDGLEFLDAFLIAIKLVGGVGVLVLDI